MGITEVRVAHFQRIHKDKCFMPLPIFFAKFMSTTEMKIPLRLTITFPNLTIERLQKLSLHRLERLPDISWHGGKQRTDFFLQESDEIYLQVCSSKAMALGFAVTFMYNT